MNTSPALNALIARLENRVAAITDTDARLSAAFALESYQGAAYCYLASVSRGPSQYSISGRAFSFESKQAAKQAMDVAKSELDGYLSTDGGTSFVDMGGGQW
jgi:hypothetical protein